MHSIIAGSDVACIASNASQTDEYTSHGIEAVDRHALDAVAVGPIGQSAGSGTGSSWAWRTNSDCFR